MVEEHEAAADAASAGFRPVEGDERTDAAVGAQDARLHEFRGQLAAFRQQQVDFFGRGPGSGNLAGLEALRGGSEDGGLAARDQDIRVGRRPAAVEHQLVEPASEHQQRALVGIHGDAGAGHRGHLSGPGAGGVDHDRRFEVFLLLAADIPHVDAHHAAAVLAQTAHFVVAENLSALGSRVEGVGEDQAERVDRGVGHAHGTHERRVDGRLDAAGLSGIDGFGVDAGGPAGRHELLLVPQVVFRQGHEQAVARVDAVRRNLLEDAVFTNALPGRLRIAHGVAGAAVEQAVVAAAGTDRQVVALHQHGLQAAEGTVACHAHAGDAAADDDHIVLEDPAGTDLRGRDVMLRRLVEERDAAGARTGVERVHIGTCVGAGTGIDPHFEFVQELAGQVPVPERNNIVAAHHQHELLVGLGAGEVAEGIDGIAGFGQVEFDVRNGHGQAGAGHGGTRGGQALAGIVEQAPALLERALGRDDQAQFVGQAVLRQVTQDGQMAFMDRIERSEEQGDSHRHRNSPTTRSASARQLARSSLTST